MNSKKLQQIKNKLNNYLKDKEILDIILFGSFVKGKAVPNDIDIAFVTNKNINPKIKNFHISIIKPSEFFHKIPTLATTLLKEGYSIKNKKTLAENLKFKNKTLFNYSLTSLKNTQKVRIVNLLRGKNKSPGMVKELGGEWLANHVFISPIKSEHLFEKFFINNKIKFKKSHLLIH